MGTFSSSFSVGGFCRSGRIIPPLLNPFALTTDSEDGGIEAIYTDYEDGTPELILIDLEDR